MKDEGFWSRYGSSVKFITIFALLFLAYKGMFFFIWRNDVLFSLYYDFSLWFINGLLSCSDYLLTTLGYSVETVEATRIVKIGATSGVTVGEPCIGFDIMALFIGLIISTNLKLKHKVYYAAIALLIVNTLNVLRISALAVLVQFDPYIWELNHKFIFTITVYVIMFIFWKTVIEPKKKPVVEL